jgi:hypothetical protein
MMFVRGFAVLATLAYATAAPFQAELVNRDARAAFPVTMDLSSGKATGNEFANDVIHEGKSIQVTFTLTREPLCGESSSKCSVLMVLTNTRPDEIALSKCSIEWHTSDPEWCCENCEANAAGPKKMCAAWMKPQVVEITTVEDFVDDLQKEILITTESLISEAEYFHGLNLPDIKIKTPNKGTAECSSTTDPNYRQWDGGRFTVNTAGTYTLWKAPRRDWEVQSRVNSQGMNCGLAMRDGCDRIVFDRCSGSFSMRKYFDQSGDPDLQPTISREGSDAWVVTSKRSGAQVKVVQRIVVVRVGWTSCGWSGCVRSPINTRKEWLDLYLRAPGADWGYFDSVTNTGAPLTTGICGTWDNRKDAGHKGDLQIAGSTKSEAQYAAHFKVSSNTLFDATPAVCLTERQPLTIEPKQCTVKPRRIQKPVISIFDIEDITELLKNSIEGEEEDEEASFVFDSGEDFQMPTRTAEFEAEARAFCKEVLLETSAFAKECAKIIVTVGERREAIDLDQFVDSCYNDIFWQGDDLTVMPIAQQTTANTLAAATYDSMENFCIESRAKSTDFKKYCTDENQKAGRCEMVDVECEGDETGNCEICVGSACTIEAKDDLKELMNQKCPNSCGANSKMSADAGGKCVEDDRGINVCECTYPLQWGGVDCTVRIGEVRPLISKLSPRGCATNKGVACTKTVVVHANTDEGTLFANNAIKCEVNGKVGNGTLLDTTQIQCDLEAEHGHDGSGAALFHAVKIAIDGKTWSSPLHFCYHNSECTECDSLAGETKVLDGKCNIDGKCYDTGDRAPGSLGACRICDPAFSATAWKYLYEDKDACGPTLDASNEIFVGEAHMLQSLINFGNPVVTKFNPRTHGDTVNPLVFEFTTPTTMFEFSSDPEEVGMITLKEPLDYETTKKYTLDVKVSQGGLSDTGTVVIEVTDVDEDATFVGAPYSATVSEADPAGVLLTVQADDPDGGEYGTVEYSLELSGGSTGLAGMPFSINKDGVVTSTSQLDYEKRKVWNMLVKASSKGGSVGRAVLTIVVTDVNEAPEFINIDRTTVPENSPIGFEVANVQVRDPDGSADTHTLTLQGGDGWFDVRDGKVVVVKSGLDYETASSKFIDFSITATDAGGLSWKEELGVRVVDANDAPGKIAVNKMFEGHNGDADGSDTVEPLAEISEVQSVGVAIAYLEVEDQDAAQTHTFAVVGTSKFAVAGNNLVLKEALDYESLFAGGKAEISVTLTSSDGVDTSAPQTFTFSVTDGEDIPRDFKFKSGGAVKELSNVGTEVGILEAIDQDEDEATQAFTLGIKAGSQFSVGETTCEVVKGTGTVCSAPVSVAGPIDFESNRVSSAQSAIALQATATYGADATTTECTDACPMVEIENVADRPTGFSIEGVGATPGGDAAVPEGTIVVGTLAAVDDDDNCPEGVPGCDDFEAAGEYSFTLLSGDNTFVLAPACKRQLTVRQRISGGDECDLRTRQGVVLRAGEDYSIKVKVTDQDKLSVETVRKIVVTEASVTLSVLGADGKPLTSLPEEHMAFGDLEVGSIKVSNWMSDSEPQPPTIASGPFKITPVGGARRSRRSLREYSWGLSVDTAALDGKINTDITFEVTMAAEGDFPGMTESFSVGVIRHVPTGDGNEICNGNDCDWAYDNADRASSAIYLSAFAPAGSSVASITARNAQTNEPAASAPTYSLVEEFPQFDMFEFDAQSGNLKTLKQASLMVNGAGLGSQEDVTVTMRATAADGSFTDFIIAVEIQYCPKNHPFCNADHTEQCVELHNGAAHFECVCVGGWMGASCGERDTEFKKNVGPDDLSLESEADGEQAAAGKKSAGGIVGIVVGVLLVLALVVGIVLLLNARKARNAETFASIRKERANTRGMEMAAVNNSNFVTGADNPTYGWYKPTLTKQSAYEQLSDASPGNFIVRDKMIQGNAGYSIHFKSPQHIVRDAYIGAGDAGHGVRLMSAPNAAPEPTFHDIPTLVDHYASLEDATAPVQLNLDNPIYFDPNALGPAASGDIYSNTAIKNTAVRLDGPSLPTKAPMHSSTSI